MNSQGSSFRHWTFFLHWCRCSTYSIFLITITCSEVYHNHTVYSRTPGLRTCLAHLPLIQATPVGCVHSLLQCRCVTVVCVCVRVYVHNRSVFDRGGLPRTCCYGSAALQRDSKIIVNMKTYSTVQHHFCISCLFELCLRCDASRRQYTSSSLFIGVPGLVVLSAWQQLNKKEITFITMSVSNSLKVIMAVPSSLIYMCWWKFRKF